MPVDINDEPLDLLDKNKDIMFDCIMPHIGIQHYKFNINDQPDNNGVIKKHQYFMKQVNQFYNLTHF